MRNLIFENAVLILLIFFLSIMKINCELEMKFLSAVFRHGDRAPDSYPEAGYPNDPYKYYDFFPAGRGGLINKGKEREYNLGKVLRKLYGDFIGDIYNPSLVKTRSTDYDRTKMSLQLVMAGLFEPNIEQIWNYELNWQPTVVDSVPSFFDSLMQPYQCYQFQEEFVKVIKSRGLRKRLSEFTDLMKDLTKWTGQNITSFDDLSCLYSTLRAEQANNLPLPSWTYSIFPNGRLLDAAIVGWETLSYNTKLNRLNGGILLRNIVEDMFNATQNEMKNRRKINLFSGHDLNVAALLHTLGVWTPHMPEYSSAIFVELLGDSEGHYVRIRYYKGIPAETIVMKIPGCDELCPFDKFREIMKPVIPSDEELVCSKESIASLAQKINDKFNYKFSS